MLIVGRKHSVLIIEIIGNLWKLSQFALDAILNADQLYHFLSAAGCRLSVARGSGLLNAQAIAALIASFSRPEAEMAPMVETCGEG